MNFEETYFWNRDSIAVVLEDFTTCYSYQELLELALVFKNNIGSRLVESSTCFTDDFPTDFVCGSTISEGVDMIAALFGIWMNGGCFVPIDIDLPDCYLEKLIKSTRRDKPMFLVCKECEIDRFTTILKLDDDGSFPAIEILSLSYLKTPHLNLVSSCAAPTSQYLSNMYFTSGTTNLPKGVLCQHRNLLHYANIKSKVHNIDCNSRVLLASSFSFDPFIGDIASTLVSGATICLLKFPKINQALLKHAITHVCTTPVIWSLVNVSPDEPDLKLKVLSLGGDFIPLNILHIWLRHVRLINMYGVTECTVYQTYHEHSSNGKVNSALEFNSKCIGQAFEGNSLYVLDENKLPVQTGEKGLLHIGGEQVCLGYVDSDSSGFCNNKELGWIYNTNDVVFEKEGKIYLEGRADSQIKLSGRRINLSSIEKLIDECSFIRAAIVLFIDDKVSAHIQWCIPNDNNSLFGLFENCFRLYCDKELPHYMHPKIVFSYSKMPMTKNGKFDRNFLRLNQVNTDRHDVSTVSLKASRKLTKIESIVARTWEKVLGTQYDTITCDSNFMFMGGDSLAALRTMQLLHSALIEHDYTCKIEVDSVRGEYAGFFSARMLLDNPRLVDFCTLLQKNFDAGDVCNGPEDYELHSEEPNNRPEQHKISLLNEACTQGCTKLVAYLLGLGINVNGLVTRNNRHLSPLHFASHNNHLEVMTILLQHGANVLAVNSMQRTPAFFAAMVGDEKSMALLLDEYRTPIQVRDQNKQNLLHAASKAGNKKTLTFLLGKNEIEIDALDRWHRAPLNWAVLNNHLHIVKILINYGANVNVRVSDYVGKKNTRLPRETALHTAGRLYGEGQMTDILLENGADSNLLDSNQRSAKFYLK